MQCDVALKQYCFHFRDIELLVILPIYCNITQLIGFILFYEYISLHLNTEMYKSKILI